ncbi:neuroligin-1-like [Palaemon carinicauda]|uniref:neuroligin-1-like n=1 Tax=Palaemon carinicauda TaxID=392227 RepID=UPI0035B6073C
MAFTPGIYPNNFFRQIPPKPSSPQPHHPSSTRAHTVSVMTLLSSQFKDTLPELMRSFVVYKYTCPKYAAVMAYPVVVFIQGESFEWGSSSLYDGSVLAALGKVIVVTLNYRIGILGKQGFSIFFLSKQEVQEGFDADYREDLLRSFVVNNYRYHLQEIMLAITAEYTDWSRSLYQPISIRDSTGQGLHDANIFSPMADLAKQLYTTSRSSYLYVLEEEGSNSGNESLLLNELAHPKDTVSNAKISESANDITSEEQIWPKYDPVYQRYFQIGTQNIVRNHYRAGKVALWSWLLPGLERVGSRYGPDKNFHRLPTDLQSGLYPESTGQYNLTDGLSSSRVTPTITGTTDIFHNLTIVAKANKIQVSESGNLDMGKDFPYTTALSLTVAIVCSLLILNILVLTTDYYGHKANRQSLAKVSQDANSEDGNDIQLHSSGDNFKTIYAPGHYGTLRPSITMHSNLASAFEEESQHDWPPDYISSVQTIDDMSGPVASYTSPNDSQLVSTYSNKENQLVQNYSPSVRQQVSSYSPKDGQLIPNYLSSSASTMHIRE